MHHDPPRAHPTVRVIDVDDDEELERYHRIDAAAFGLPPNTEQLASKRPLIQAGRWFLAELDGEGCGGAGSFESRLTLPGGATVPVAAVSDVGVLPTHRRRGVLSALMRTQLADRRELGDVAAVLHASEAGIYRRFGYGTATRWRHVSLDRRRAAFRADWPDPGGRVSMVSPAQAHDICAAVHERRSATSAGGLARSDAWWEIVLGEVPSYIGGGTRRLVIVHHDDSGTADGYAIYELTEDWSTGQANHLLEVWELVGVDEAVELALWRVLLDHDLVARVEGPIAVDHVLRETLADPRQMRTVIEQDLLWLRLLDIGAALSLRAYPGAATDESLVFGVDDRLFPDASGSYELEVTEGRGVCRRSHADADLVLDVAELGTCVLGGGSFRRLVRAGRVEERTPGAAARADRVFGIDPLPWCWVRF
ncbi:MAG: GNAT family N-acetyltransferase [Microthrixaceae bacterium]